MPLLGAHMSIAGGYFKAADGARHADRTDLFQEQQSMERDGENLDAVNLRTLRGLIAANGVSNAKRRTKRK